MNHPILFRPPLAAALVLAALAGFALTVRSAVEQGGFDPAPVVPLASQPPSRLIVDSPLPEQLAMGRVVVRYRTENLRIVPVFGPAALDDSPHISHLHITVDDAPWHWADESGEPLIIQGHPPGSHQIRVDLADPTHKVIESTTINLEIPQPSASHN